MAATTTRLSCLALRCTSRKPAPRNFRTPSNHVRHLHRTPLYRRKANPEEEEEGRSSQRPERQEFKFDIKELNDDERSAYNALSANEQKEWREEAKQVHDYMTSPEVESELMKATSRAAYETSEAMPNVEINIPRVKPGLMAMGEVEDQDIGPDEEFEGDDITSLGHGELEQHREMRHYARIAAWEMPLLSSNPTFTPPHKRPPVH